MSAITKGYCFSDRLYEAFLRLNEICGTPVEVHTRGRPRNSSHSSALLRQGLELLSQHLELRVAENIGTDERAIPYRISGLEERDLLSIDLLAAEMGVRSTSAVVRNAIEVLINRHGLTQFKKPEGWVSRPLSIRQAGTKGLNPNPKLPYSLVPMHVKVPLWLWSKLEPNLKFSDDAEGISALARIAISNCIGRQMVPLTKEQLSDEKRPITVLLYEYQIAELDKIRLAHNLKKNNQALLVTLSCYR